MTSNEFDYIAIIVSVVISIIIDIYCSNKKSHKRIRVIFFVLVIISFGIILPYISQRLWLNENISYMKDEYFEPLQGLFVLQSLTKFIKYWFFGALVLFIPLITAMFKSRSH